MKYHRTLAFLLLVSWVLLPSASYALNQGPGPEQSGQEELLVGRIAHVEGSVLSYIPEEGVWVQAATDFPFGLEDKLRSDRRSRAEVILPNNAWFRMDGDTHLHLLSLQPGGTELHMVHGSARFMNKGSHSNLYVSTPFGEVHGPAQTSFDLHVNDASAEVVVLRGSVYFSRDGGRTKTEVYEGSASLIADRYALAAGQGYRVSPWDAWNQERDALWAQRLRAGLGSAKYLPPTLHDHAYALDDHGMWQRVYYDGSYGYLWRPLYVSAGWAPYTVGRWNVWYGDHVWNSREPFGYVTHHYGTWVYTGGYWYWAPPVTSLSVRFVHPSLRIGLAWYPGRVAWFHSGTSIGWIALAPHEPYYANRRWGPGTVIVKNVRVVNVEARNYRNERRAVIIDKGRLHTTDNYRNASVRIVDRRTLGAGIQAQPAAVQRRSARDPGSVNSTTRAAETVRRSRADLRSEGTNRRDEPAGWAADRGAAGADNRIKNGRTDASARRDATPAVQQRSPRGQDPEREKRRAPVLTRDKAPEPNNRPLPAGPRINRQNLQTPAASRQSPTSPQMGTPSPRTPAPARVRARSDRPAAESGDSVRSLPQQKRQDLERTRPDAGRSSNGRIQRVRAAPDNAPSRNQGTSNNGRRLAR